MSSTERFRVVIVVVALIGLVAGILVVATRPDAQSPAVPAMRQGGAAYPVIGRDIQSVTVRDSLNRAIRERAMQAVSPPGSGETIIEAHSEYQTPLFEHELLSLRFENYLYWWHAAHGTTKVTSITLSLKTGREYRFAELFRPKSDYRGVLTAEIQRQITERQVALLRPFEGVGPDEQYYLTSTGLVVYYQQYDYAPYSFGILEFKIPHIDLAKVAAPSGPIGRLLHR